MLVKIRERKQERFRFPVALHLIQAVGALTLHTGVGTISLYSQSYGHKKCPQQCLLASHPRLYQM
jgi:hypothetical protein